MLLLVAVYLLCQCSVNYATFRDACNRDTRWSMIFNIINTIMAAALLVFACSAVCRNYQSPELPDSGWSKASDTNSASLFDS